MSQHASPPSGGKQRQRGIDKKSSLDMQEMSESREGEQRRVGDGRSAEQVVNNRKPGRKGRGGTEREDVERGRDDAAGKGKSDGKKAELWL